MYSKVIFVDGPSGIGKGYFIETYTSIYKLINPSAKIKTCVLADMVLTDELITEKRKYTTYATQKKHLDKIHTNHITALEGIRDMVVRDNYDLVIIDRSYLSFLIYNVIPTQPQLEDIYSTKYMLALEKIFKDINIKLYILEHDGDDYEEVITTRLKTRGDGKSIDLSWVRYLKSEYYKDRNLLLDSKLNVTRCESGDSVKELMEV